jgi:putative transcriptional regulator
MPTQKEIADAREAAGLTQDEAGKLVHTDWRGWQQWEYGKRNMRSRTWELFNIKVAALKEKKNANHS